jgi:hypothetical protein
MTTCTAIDELLRADAPASRARAGRIERFLFFFALLFGALTSWAGPAHGDELRLSTENDFFVESRHKDDLYTFSVGLDFERGPYTFELQEHAFTDREAQVRFDETHLVVTRLLAGPSWDLELTGGVVHVGKGLFGESTQNAVHDLFGNEEVRLPYADSELYARAGAAVQRWWLFGEGLTLGPHVEIDLVPGLHSHAVVAGQLEWQAARHVAVQLLAGHRFTKADNEALERRLASNAAIGRLSLILAQRIEVTWSYNERGDQREHLTVGYRVPSGVWRKNS